MRNTDGQLPVCEVMGLEIKIYENSLTMAAMQSLRISCGLELLESGMLKRALTNSLLKITAVMGNQMVGMLRVAGDGCFIFVIADVMVDPAYRNRGIASALVKYALQRIEDMLPSGMTGIVSLFATKGKEDLYARLGFNALTSENKGPGMQTTVIGKNRFL